MKRLQIPENKFPRLLINLLGIFVWYLIYSFTTWKLLLIGYDFVLKDRLGYELFWISNVFFASLPMFFITRYVWFKKVEKEFFMVYLIN